MEKNQPNGNVDSLD